MSTGDENTPAEGVQDEVVLDAELVDGAAAEAAAAVAEEDGSTGALASEDGPAPRDEAAASDDDAGDAAAPAAEAPEAADEPDYKDRYLRSAAEMDNLRKRARRDVGVAEGRGIGRLAKELMPALDNLDRALAAAEAADGDDEHTLTRGIRLVQAELVAALDRVGVKVEIPLGAPFDPHRHEALTQQPRENVAPGLVVEVYQPGYVYEDTVLRAAKVVVSA